MVSDLLVIQRERTDITFGDVQLEYIAHLEFVLCLNCSNPSSNLLVLKWLISFQKVNWLRLCNVMSQMWYWYINTSCLVFILLDSLLVWTPCYTLILPIAIVILLISMSLTASLLGMSSDESTVFFSLEQGTGRLLQETAKASWVSSWQFTWRELA